MEVVKKSIEEGYRALEMMWDGDDSMRININSFMPLYTRAQGTCTTYVDSFEDVVSIKNYRICKEKDACSIFFTERYYVMSVEDSKIELKELEIDGYPIPKEETLIGNSNSISKARFVIHRHYLKTTILHRNESWKLYDSLIEEDEEGEGGV